MNSVAEAAPRSRGGSVQTWGGVTSLARAVRRFFAGYLDVVLGAVLVLAGALKGQQLLTDPSVGRATGFPRELLIGAAAFELAFGCWLLAGLYRRLTRWLALAWFTSLAAVALAQALGGAPACPCFGELHTHPWLIFAFDVLAVAALRMWSPNSHFSQGRLPAALCLSLLTAGAFLGLASAPRDRTLFAEIDLGEIAQGGQKQKAFQFRNDSGAFVEVAVIETSCPCASIRLERTAVAAGQFLAGNVTLDLRLKPE
ncbi:MAG: MauE/DoxX family redox-associated membrane protein, partial [Gemmataceae bacterium]